MSAKTLRVLRRQGGPPSGGKVAAELGEARGFDLIGRAAAEKAQVRHPEGNRSGVAGDRTKRRGNLLFLIAGQMVEQRQMRRDEVAPGRKVPPAHGIEMGEARRVEAERQDQGCVGHPVGLKAQ